jgi:hypothetical protein
MEVQTMDINLNPSKGLKFALNDDGVSYSVAGIGDCTDTEIVIPPTYDGKPVTGIGHHAFAARDSLTSITIPNSIQYVDELAFDLCTSLKSVHITDLEAWCNISFAGYVSNPCSNGADLYLNGEKLTELVIPDTVTAVKDYAYKGCTSITSVTMHENVTSIGEEAFWHCTSLTRAAIPEGITDVGAKAFFHCDSLKRGSIPHSMTNIGFYLYYDCNALESIHVPESVTNISHPISAWCPALKSITVDENNPKYHSAGNCLIETESKTLVAGCATSVIPDDGSVTSIGSRSFMWDPSLTSIIIPAGIKSIEWLAFYECTSLTSVTIPNSVTSIGDLVFAYCRNLSDIYYDGTPKQFYELTKHLNLPVNATVHFTNGECTVGELEAEFDRTENAK